MVDEGCIHGRFQPFHNGHLEYALAALERSSFLWIGLADPFPPAPPRQQPDHQAARSTSSLTYHERQFMITRTLVAEGIPPERFSFTPFPIRTPDLLPQYLDLGITCFARVDGERLKRESAALQKLGYPVQALRVHGQHIETSSIPALIIRNEPSWRTLVPSSVSCYLDEIRLASRLRQRAD